MTPSNVITYRSELIESEKVVVDIRSIISEAAEGNVVVEVESESDGSYFFECSESLPTVNWKFLSRLEGTGRTLRFEDMVSNQQNRFYRVRKQFAANSSRGSLK